MMMTVRFSDTSVHFYQTTRRLILEDSTIQFRICFGGEKKKKVAQKKRPYL
jgi:hypothetical protein